MSDVEQLRALIAGSPLPRAELLTITDMARTMHVSAGTLRVWAHRGFIQRYDGRFDWREVALRIMERKHRMNRPKPRRIAG